MPWGQVSQLIKPRNLSPWFSPEVTNFIKCVDDMLSKQEVLYELSTALFTNAKGAFLKLHLLMVRFSLNDSKASVNLLD